MDRSLVSEGAATSRTHRERTERRPPRRVTDAGRPTSAVPCTHNSGVITGSTPRESETETETETETEPESESESETEV